MCLRLFFSGNKSFGAGYGTNQPGLKEIEANFTAEGIAENGAIGADVANVDTALLYTVLDMQGNIIYQASSEISSSVNEAVKHRDTILDMDKKHAFGSFTEAFDLMRSELKKAGAAEKKANDDKKEMVAKLSHDIKTPIASIISTSEIGFELAMEERPKELFNLINVKTDQITTLVDNLFLTSVPDSGVQIYIDKLRMQQTLDNIFMNSYKYANTDMTVLAGLQDEYLVLTIADAGVGVKEEELPLLKEKYKRGSNISEKEGAGLGLYLADYFMDNMDGKLALANCNPGFAVTLYLRTI